MLPSLERSRSRPMQIFSLNGAVSARKVHRDWLVIRKSFRLCRCTFPFDRRLRLKETYRILSYNQHHNVDV